MADWIGVETKHRRYERDARCVANADTRLYVVTNSVSRFCCFQPCFAPLPGSIQWRIADPRPSLPLQDVRHALAIEQTEEKPTLQDSGADWP